MYKKAINLGKPSQMLLRFLKSPVDEGGLGVELSKAVVIGDALGDHCHGSVSTAYN